MPRSKLSDFIRCQVRRRAGYLCEYCHASEQWQYVQFTVDHVVPLDLEGSDDLENLALACFHCNRRKWNRVRGVDPDSGDEVALFNPRSSRWADHFIWASDRLTVVGLTSVGRATVTALDLNRQRIVNIRAADAEVGRHPPENDPVQDKADG